MTIFTTIAEAYKDRLLLAPQITGDRVQRGRRAALKKGWADGIVVRQVRTAAQLAGVGMAAPKDWTTQLGIEVLARGLTAEAAEDSVDTLLALVYARLAGWSPTGLSVLDALSAPSISWDSDEGEDAVAGATIVVSITHRTQPTALVAWG
jgi:D-serine deaminase-like pyridoxal phosphate-dependent protein